MSRFLTLLGLGVLVLAAPALHAQAVPTTLSYQGALTDGAGNPVPDGNYAVALRLFTAASGGTAAYAENHNVTTAGGVFSAELGAGTPVTGTWASTAFDKGYWLETAVGGTTLSPRTKLLAGPYARALTLPYAASAGLSGYLLDFTNTSGSGIQAVVTGPYGLRGESAAATGSGVTGVATSATGASYGGFFQSASTSGRAVHAQATANSGATYGVYASSASASGYGLYAFNTAAGGYAARFGDLTRFEADINLYDGTGTDARIILDVDEGAEAPSLKLRRNDVTVLELDADHNGNARVITEELEITGGADLAEHFDVALLAGLGAPLPGMVVSIDPESPGRLTVSATPYDALVAGVVSGAGGVRPGFVMGQRGSIADGDVPIALVGRVYVLVDASYGAVRPGDLLTTSATAGHAMRAADRAQAQGAVLGKAMTGLASGRGLVLVLVGLQ